MHEDNIIAMLDACEHEFDEAVKIPNPPERAAFMDGINEARKVIGMRRLRLKPDEADAVPDNVKALL